MEAAKYLEQAASLVSGERAIQHGGMTTCHRNIASFWTVWLKQRGLISGELTAHDAAMMMALVKIARVQSGAHNPDSYTDLAGYAGIAGHLADLMHEEVS